MEKMHLWKYFQIKLNNLKLTNHFVTKISKIFLVHLNEEYMGQKPTCGSFFVLFFSFFNATFVFELLSPSL